MSDKEKKEPKKIILERDTYYIDNNDTKDTIQQIIQNIQQDKKDK
jgi:hypothetical protein